MKELLIQLQSFPKTWEKFIQHSEPLGMIALKSMDFWNFCDGEGYYVVARPYYVYQANCFKWKYEITKFQLEEIEEFGNLSRHEAFNAGMIKAFELMESKEVKNE